MRTVVIVLSGMLLAAPGISLAADPAPAFAPTPETTVQDEWSFSFAPYLWTAGISGDTAVFGLPEVHINQSFGDILADIDFGFMAAGDARYGPFSIVTDIEYVRITSDAATPRGVLADEVDLKSVTFTALVGAGYTVLEDPNGRLDVIAGLRVWSVETTISFSGGPLGGISRSDDATWVDGMAGVRGVYSITPTVYLTGWGLIGAGGADLDWDVMGGVGYKWKEWLSAFIGYRALGVNYSNDSLTQDVIEHGPILGAVFRF
ncbi:hypothetical protein HGP14_09275 [Rhizobium sp. P32RR-XVIII]|uniref:hypothetical protein n=1 Tax=Rhizobium sp. P32RR-XVIII TaxID=2726738 RepID=UPI001456BF4B|nr:hypothetical protein [Rhizobium sp. P32RR-XVIII]NLS03549.1 hypothetical protein [Rhizobium sp. P32RR-XVIII]